MLVQRERYPSFSHSGSDDHNLLAEFVQLTSRPEWLGRGRQVKEMFPAVNLLYVTTNPAADVAAEALRRGASGYLPNSQRSLRRGQLQLGTPC